MSVGDDLKRAFAEAQREQQEKVVHLVSPADTAPKIEPIDFATLPDVEPPPRRFLIQEWLPDGCLSSLYGPGGVGKSLLAQQAATCLATGRDFLGMKVDQTPVLGLFSEDDDDELKRRQWRINQALGLKNKDLDHLHIEGRSGLNNVIVSFPKGAPRKEALYEIVVKRAREYEAGLVELDNRAQMLLVEENDRAQATFAANLCAGIAREINGACLLLGHTAKADGSEYSGSTAWDAVTRSRWWLRRVESENKEAEPQLLLERPKSNYSAQGKMLLVWKDGIFRAADPALMTAAERLEMQMRQGAACQAFLDCLDQLTTQGRPVSHSSQAKNYAPKVMAPLVEGFSKGELEQAMEKLFTDGRIEANVCIGRDRHRNKTFGLARKGSAHDPRTGPMRAV
jgi:RecA-family ATPase